MNLNTTYLGLQLPHPLMVGPGPLTDELDSVKQLEDNGAAALVLRSLYEEEIKGEQMAAFCNTEPHNESFAEATSYYPEPESAFGPEEYLEHLRRVKNAVRIPVMASLNGTSIGGWTSYAKLIEQAGADAARAVREAPDRPTGSRHRGGGKGANALRSFRAGGSCRASR